MQDVGPASPDLAGAMHTLPQDPLKLMSLAGALCSDLGLHDQALVIFRGMALLRCDDPHALVSMALALSRSGDESGALVTLRRALERNPMHDMARVVMAIHLQKVRRAEARQLLLAVLSDGRDADALGLADSVRDEILNSEPVAAPSTDRMRRVRYTRIAFDS